MSDGADSPQSPPSGDRSAGNWQPPRSDTGFYAGLGVLSGTYVLLIVGMLAADVYYAAKEFFQEQASIEVAENDPETIYSVTFDGQTVSVPGNQEGAWRTAQDLADAWTKRKSEPFEGIKAAALADVLTLTHKEQRTPFVDRLSVSTSGGSGAWGEIEKTQDGTSRKAWGVLFTPEIRYSTWLSLISCSITTILSLWVAVPIGYLMSRHEFRGKVVIDAILDIPIFLPPLVVGLSLLILFRQTPLVHLDNAIGIALSVPAVIIAQFAVASAFAVRAMRATFDEISPRAEQVAMTLGCSRTQAFWWVVLPEARHGLLTAATLAWARALGEFGPILVFAGTTRLRTEVLPVSVHMEISTGNLAGAVGVSLLMVVIALLVLIVVRALAHSDPAMRGFRR